MHRPSCRYHPGVPAVARCVGCGGFLCAQCVVEDSARAYCSLCMEEIRRGRIEKEREDTEAPDRSSHEDLPLSGAPAEKPAGSGEGGPVGARVVASCAFHPGVRAVTRCSSCGALICAGCQRVVGGRRVCDNCFQSMAYGPHNVAGGTRRARQARVEPSLAASPWKLWPGLVFLPLPFALSGLMTYMMRAGEEVSVGAAQLLLSLLLYSAMLCFAFATVARYGPAFQEMGFSARNLPSSLGLGFIGGALAFWTAVAAGALSMGLLNQLGWLEEWLQGFFDVNVKSTTGTDLIIAGLVIVVAAPVCEEIFFRGYLYPAMRGRLGIWGAIFLNGVLFSVVHFSLFGLLGRTLAGIIFCILYEYNDNLWSPITAHAVNNFVAFFLPLVYISTS